MRIDELDVASVTVLCGNVGLDMRSVDFEEEEWGIVNCRFEWIAGETEQDQKRRILEYMWETLEYARVGSVTEEDAASHGSLLDADHERLPFALRGTTDIVLVNNEAQKYNDLMVGLRMAIMVRPKLKPRHRAEAIAKLLSVGLNLPTSYFTMVLVTDLQRE